MIDLSKHQATFADSGLNAKARHLLATKHIVVLYGPQHSGKRTIGLDLLQAEHAGQIDEIAADVLVKDFEKLALAPRRGYIVNSLSKASLLGMTLAELGRLARRLRSIGSHLVLIVDQAQRLSHPIDEYLATVDAVAVPIALQILERHALWQLGSGSLAAQILAWCGDKRVQAALADRTPREVVELSALLADAARGRFDLADALWRFRVGDGQARRWFDEHPACEHRAAMVAIAALNGAPCQQVLDAQFMLLRLIEPDTTGLAPRCPPAFDPLDCEWIDECCAHIVPGEQRALGQSSPERIELSSPELRDQVLRYVWQECDLLHQALLSWLCYLGGSDDQLVRNRAAEVAAVFARFDLEQVYREVLVIWAAHELPEVRFAAALALAYLAFDEDHDWSALRLTQDLAGNAPPICKLAAATAYGGGVGVRFPDQALVDLAALALYARADPPELLGEISQSVVNLFELSCAGQVLAALSQWVAVPHPDTLAMLGEQIFLTIVDLVTDASGGLARPLQLWPAHTLLAHRKHAAEIWGQLLNASWARPAALDALHRSIAHADTQPQLYTAIEGVVSELYARGTAHERERLLFYLRQWAHPPAPRQASQAADTILAAVAQIA